MKDKAKLLRNELKALGLTSQDVSVRVKPCTYSERMDVIIKNLSIDIKEIERLARKYEKVDRDEITGEILAGGNDYVYVAYDWEVLKKEGENFLPLAEKILNTNMGEVIAKTGEYRLYYFADVVPYLFVEGGSERRKLPAGDKWQLAESLAKCRYLYGFNFDEEV